MDTAIPMARAESAKLQWRVKQGQYNERLDRLEKEGPPEKARRARQAGEKVIAARDRNYEILSRRWPVDPTRVCSYALLDFSGALNLGDTSGGPGAPGRDPQAPPGLRGQGAAHPEERRGLEQGTRGGARRARARSPAPLRRPSPSGAVPVGVPGSKPPATPEGK